MFQLSKSKTVDPQIAQGKHQYLKSRNQIHMQIFIDVSRNGFQIFPNHAPKDGITSKMHAVVKTTLNHLRVSSVVFAFSCSYLWGFQTLP